MAEILSRNQILGFVERTRKNLMHIEYALDNGSDVHVITQLVCSLLGLIIVPWEQEHVQAVEALRLEALVTQGWPEWEITLGSCTTLGDLIRHLRNAAAHGNFRFSSENRDLTKVTIFVHDKRPNAPPYWKAHIRADRLREFCLRFIALLHSYIG